MNKFYSLLAILAVAVLIGAGCTQTEETVTNEPITIEVDAEDVTTDKDSMEKAMEEESEEETTEESEEASEETAETTEEAEETTEETTEEETAVEETTSTEYTLAQVAEHDSSSDCWMALDGKVYDVTNFISSHPGGSAILRGCGTDATSIFEAQGHSSAADAVKADYEIGTLAQ